MKDFLFGLPLIVVILISSCGPVPGRILKPDQQKAEYLLKVDSSHSPGEKARWLYLLAQAYFKDYKTKEGKQTPETSTGPKPDRGEDDRKNAIEALLRIVEIGEGPIEEARYNLSLLLKDENQESQDESKDDPEEQKDQENNSEQENKNENQSGEEEPRDLSGLTQDRSEEDKRMEELKMQEQKRMEEAQDQVRGTPVPLDRDW